MHFTLLCHVCKIPYGQRHSIWDICILVITTPSVFLVKFTVTKSLWLSISLQWQPPDINSDPCLSSRGWGDSSRGATNLKPVSATYQDLGLKKQNKKPNQTKQEQPLHRLQQRALMFMCDLPPGVIQGHEGTDSFLSELSAYPLTQLTNLQDL